MTEARLTAEALSELNEAALWYDRRSRGLGTELLDDVERALSRVEALPESFPCLRDLPEELGVRRALLPRFPYALVFIVTSEEIRVIAVAHTKRRARYWLDRLR